MLNIVHYYIGLLKYLLQFFLFYMYTLLFFIYNSFCCRVTCVYLACKVEEFNVSIMQFVSNIKGDRGKAAEIILNNELLLMQHLRYHLTIHNPFRPVEGFLLDIKVIEFCYFIFG